MIVQGEKNIDFHSLRQQNPTLNQHTLTLPEIKPTCQIFYPKNCIALVCHFFILVMLYFKTSNY